MNPAIETTNLTRDFGKFRAVNQLNLRVEAGKFYGFLGPNGAGKSTTIKMFTGLLAPSSGTMRILGEDMSDPRRALRGRGCRCLASLARYLAAMRRARRDGVSHLARAGDRGKTLHGRRHHRARRTGASRHDGRIATRRIARGQIS